MPGMISKMSRVEISNRFYNALAGTLVKICDVVDYRYREYYNMYPRRARTAVLSKARGCVQGGTRIEQQHVSKGSPHCAACSRGIV